VAREIVNHLTNHKGLITNRDLQDFRPTTRQPLRASYKGYEIISAPPPSAGGAIIIQTLNILENFQLQSSRGRRAERLHVLAEAQARSSVKCRATISDPDFTHINLELIVAKATAKEQASTISLNHSSMPTDASTGPTMPASNTTHFVAVDAEHNIVSLTESLECYFGSGVTVPGTGIILNDTMHDFEPRPLMPNSVGPGKIPMSSMSPTIVLKEGKPILALGSAGGPRIVSSTLQALVNVLEDGMGLVDAVAAPRMHQNGSVIELEPSIGREVPRELRDMGHSIRVKRRVDRDDPGLYFGGVHAARISDDNTLTGAADPRRDGLAVGIP
jgi:gamma-glutamyltranspeptidase/glutathione hydrolase